MTTLVESIEEMLRLATTDERAAVAVLAGRGKVRAFSPHYAMLGSADQKRLVDGVEEMMQGRGFVDSATGISAALAMNMCEAKGLDYRLEKRGEMYRVWR